MNVVLTLLLVAAGMGCALTSVLTARLWATPRVAWLGLAAQCASLRAVPVGAHSALGLPDTTDDTIDTVDLAISSVTVVLLMAALLSPAPPGRRGVARVLAVAVVPPVTAVLVASVFPGALRSVEVSAVHPLALTVTWMALAVSVGLLPVRSDAPGLRALAVGTIMLCALPAAGVVVGLVRSSGRSGLPSLWLPAAFWGLVAVGLGLYGTVGSIRSALARADDLRDSQEEELRLAAICREQIAERDHELRSGLASLAGATRLLGAECSGDQPLDELVVSELRRLQDLLRPAVLDGPLLPYDVESVLRGLVLLRNAAGMDVRLETDPGLHAVGASETLAAVVTNLITNAQRHAPGSPVRITAMRWNSRVVVRVRDFGPGVAPPFAAGVFERGVRDESRGGSGLGLHVCRRMLSAEHGSIDVRPRDPTRPGFVVVVELPAPAAPSEATSVRLRGIACVTG